MIMIITSAIIITSWQHHPYQSLRIFHQNDNHQHDPQVDNTLFNITFVTITIIMLITSVIINHHINENHYHDPHVDNTLFNISYPATLITITILAIMIMKITSVITITSWQHQPYKSLRIFHQNDNHQHDPQVDNTLFNIS